MSIHASPRYLPRILLLDAASGLACGTLQLGLTDLMAVWTGLPAALLSATGLFLLAYGGAVAVLTLRGRALQLLTWTLLVGNLAWVVACLGLLLGGWGTPTPWGTGYVLLQAATVALWAQLQWLWLRHNRSRASMAL